MVPFLLIEGPGGWHLLISFMVCVSCAVFLLVSVAVCTWVSVHVCVHVQADTDCPSRCCSSPAF